MTEENKYLFDNTFYYDDTDYREQEKKRQWHDLVTRMRRNHIIGARVISAEYNSTGTEVLVEARINENFTVKIPGDHFLTGWNFTENYEKEDKKEQLTRRLQMTRQALGAWVPVIIKGMDSYLNEDGEVCYSIFGSRTEALEAKKQEYFNGKDSLKEGDVVKASVFTVGEHYANLEVLGVECAISAANIDAFSYIYDCRQALHPGDSIDVMVRSVETDENGNIILDVSGSMLGAREASNNIVKLSEGCSYSGIVRNYNREKDIYTVILDCRAIVAVRRKFVLDNSILIRGDRVTVNVYRKGKKYAWGTAKKM